MTHHFFRHGTDYGYPVFGYRATFARGMGAGQCPSFGPHRLGYQVASTPPMRDRDIRKLVTNYLSSDPRLSPAAEIVLEVTDGVVILRGNVPDKWNKYFAGDDCFNIPAVVDVVNNLKIVERPREEE